MKCSIGTRIQYRYTDSYCYCSIYHYTCMLNCDEKTLTSVYVPLHGVHSCSTAIQHTVANNPIRCVAPYIALVIHLSTEHVLCRRRIVVFITLHCSDRVLYAFALVCPLSSSPTPFFNSTIVLFACNVIEFFLSRNSLFKRIVWLRMLYLDAVVKTLMENRSHINK